MTGTEYKLCKSVGQFEPAHMFKDEIRKENQLQEIIKFFNRSLWISLCFGKNKGTQNHILESKVSSILKKKKRYCIIFHIHFGLKLSILQVFFNITQLNLIP